MFQGALRLKYKKMHKSNLNASATDLKFFCPKFADVGLQAQKSVKITPRQMETGRRFIRRLFGRGVKIKINMFPYHSYTTKPISARMGKGKGRIAGWFFPCKKGRIIFEISFNRKKRTNIAFILQRLQIISKKFPGQTKVVRLIY